MEQQRLSEAHACRHPPPPKWLSRSDLCAGVIGGVTLCHRYVTQMPGISAVFLDVLTTDLTSYFHMSLPPGHSCGRQRRNWAFPVRAPTPLHSAALLFPSSSVLSSLPLDQYLAMPPPFHLCVITQPQPLFPPPLIFFGAPVKVCGRFTVRSRKRLHAVGCHCASKHQGDPQL